MKKVLSFVLAVAMVLCFAACGNDEPAGNPGNENNETVVDDAAKVIKIGGIGPLTGDYANYGLSVNQGAKIAVEEINKAGGINGMQIDLNFQDSQGDPDSAVNAYGKLIDWGMDISLSGVFSGENASITAAAAEDDMFLLSASASADVCIAANDAAYRVCFYDSFQGIAAADYIKDNNMADKVGVFYQSDIDYSIGLYESFKAECEKIGVEIVEVQSFTLDTNTSFETQINALVSSGVKVVFMPIYAAEASTFLSQAKNGTPEAKFAEDVYFFGADGLDGIIGKVEQSPKTADNVLMLTPFAADNPDEQVQSFVEAYKAAYGVAPDQFAAGGYDAAYILKAIVENAGITDASEITEAEMIKQILALEYKGVTGTMTWTEDGNTQKAALAIIYKDGVGSMFGA